MKRISLIAILIAATLSNGVGQTIPLYDNNSELIAPGLVPVPVIDARAWVNRALFSVVPLSGLPFEAYNNVRFTNQNAVQMFADPGIRFRNRNQNSNGWAWMDTWINRGSIVTDHTTFLGSVFGNVFSFDSRASILQVAATNITSQGSLASGTHGLIRLEGKKIDVSRSTLRTGSAQTSNTLFGTTLGVGISNYVNDVGIRDLYWGVGVGDAVAAANSGAMQLTANSIYPNFNTNNPTSSIHEVIQPSTLGGFLFTNSTIVPNGFFFSGNNAFINTNNVQYLATANYVNLSATNRLVQVVFYPSNVNDPDFSAEVRFYSTGLNRPARPTVAFHAKELDITTRATSVNSVYLVDALATTTNSFLARNLSGSTRRPNTFSVTRQEPFEYRLGSAGVPLVSNTFYGNSYTRTEATNRYAAYAAQVELLSSSSSGSIPYDVTNAPGRIEIIGDEVNLDQTRIRAESAVIIKAQNLISNNFAQVDAPLVNFDVRSVQPVFNVVNLAPTAVRRFGGAVRAWSAVWDNFEAVATGTNFTTNTITFHVLIVESQLRSTVPVTVNEFAARATNIVIGDQLNIAKSFVVEGNSLHVTGGISMPVGKSLTASNLLNVRNFTNDGIISVQGSAFYGTDRALSYSNWVNHGTNTASAIEIRTRNFENSGALVAGRGAFTLDAVTASMLGNPLITSNFVTTNISFDFFTGFLLTNVFTNTATLQAAPVITAISDLDIRARDFVMSNAVINAGTLIFNVTNRLADSGSQATNVLNATAGFQTVRRPTTSSLFGTHLRSSAPFFGLADHVWAGVDMGNTNAGFTNNLALGKLTLDGGENSVFRFFPAGTSNALYVDYIQLENWATNFNTAFSISPGLTIYFANANVPVTKLHGAAGGRFQWVRSFAGPLSSTNIYYASTSNTYTFNIALVTDNDIDSDGNGIVNSEDPEPIPVPEEVVLSASAVRVPNLRMMLKWNGIAYSRNVIEYSSSTAPGQWSLLTNFQMGPFNNPVTVVDPVGTNGEMRVYRLRVDLQ